MTQRLAFNPGLNRVVLADLPGMPRGAAGSRANQWLCSWAIGQRMSAAPRLLAAAQDLAGGPDRLPALPTLEIQPTATTQLIDAGLPWAGVLDALVGMGDRRALALADDLGRVLGGLVATLSLGPIDARTGRPEWPASQWELWRRVRRVDVAGGIVAGDLGLRMVDAARQTLARLDAPVAVELARQPTSLVLRGTAVGDVADGLAAGLVLDCGGSGVKRAVVLDGRLTTRPPAPAPGPALAAYQLVGHLTEAACRVAPPGDGPLGVAYAVAAYVDATGRPYGGQLGPYAALASVDLVGELTRRLSRRLSRQVAVRVRHDGGAALLGARLDKPSVDAVIVLGTAIGNAVDPVDSSPSP